MLVGNLGSLEEGIALLRRAATLDPLSVQVYRSLAGACVRAGRLDEAEAAATKALELNPRGGLTHAWMGTVRLLQGRLDEAQEMFQQESHDTFRVLGLTMVYHARGQRAESEAAMQELIEKNAAGGAFQIAEAYAYRGETDLAFEWLERAYVQRDPGIGMTKVAQPLRSLHGDPRWQPFLEKTRLADVCSPG
jgi:tetratricopeptide (TPR) repeat protein